MSDRTTADDFERVGGGFFLGLATTAIALGMGVAPALRGAAVGLDPIIDRVDLGTSILAQATTLVTLVFGVTRAAPFVASAQPWPIALSAVFGALGSTLLGIAASRSSVPEELVVGGAAFFGVGLGLFGVVARLAGPSRAVALAFAALLLAETLPPLAEWVHRASPGSAVATLLLPAACLAPLVLVGATFVEWSRTPRRPLTIAVGLVGALLGAILTHRAHPGLAWSLSHSVLASLTDGASLPRALSGALLGATALFLASAARDRDVGTGFAGLLSLIALAPKSPLTLMVAGTAVVLFSVRDRTHMTA